MMRRLVTSLLVACALSVAAPAIAGAQSGGGTGADAITDCNNHGTLTAHYSSDALRNALANMPADVREYTDCYDVIEKQLFAQLGTSSTGGSGGSGSSSGGSVLPTWLVIVIVVLALAALTFGALAIRRRRLEGTEGPGSPDAGGGSEPPSQGGPDAPGREGPDDPGSPEQGADDPSGSGPGSET